MQKRPFWDSEDEDESGETAFASETECKWKMLPFMFAQRPRELFVGSGLDCIVELEKALTGKKDTRYEDAARWRREHYGYRSRPAAPKPAAPVPTTRVRRDGKVDGRCLVQNRPSKNHVKSMAWAVSNAIIRSKKRNAKGQYRIALNCGHTIWRAVSNGSKPEEGKFYACPVCSAGGDEKEATSGNKG